MELANTGAQAKVPSNSLLQIMRRHPLLFYFLIAFGFTWAYELLVNGVLHLPFIPWYGPASLLGPTISAFIMTILTERKPGVLRLLRRYVLWRVGIPWYLLVLLGVPALLLIAVLLLPGALAAFRLPALSFWPTYLIWYLLALVFGGPLGEEVGWRGFALPRLQQHSGPLVGTLLLGVLWGLWHLPLFLFIPGFNGAGTGFVGILGPFVVFVIFIIAFTCIFTWVFNNTRGSLLLAILLHASYNAAYSGMLPKFFPSLPVTLLFALSVYSVFVVVALLVIAATRGRLSYQRYLRETALPAPVTDREQEQGEVRTSV